MDEYTRGKESPGALQNVKILDFSRMYAGPFCTQLLADLGAEVTKVEIPGGGDATRTFSPQTDGSESYIFIILNRNKKSITLNLRSEEGRDICRQLVERTDVLVENFTPGVMERHGLGYDHLKQINPGLIYASLSGFGQTGPKSSRPAFDIIAQAMGGWLSLTGFPDKPPTKTGPSLADFTAALYTAVAILAAVNHRAVTGEGQFVDISMQDCVWATAAIEAAPRHFLTGSAAERLGNANGQVTPFSIYPAQDGYVAITVVTIGQWEKFISVIGREDLWEVQKYATQSERIKYRQEIDALVEEWTRVRTVEEITESMEKAHLPCSPVPGFDEVANDPQLLSREMVTHVEQVVSGKLKVPGSVFKMSRTPGNGKMPAPFLGQHNREVYCDLLRYSENDLARLADEGVI